MIWSDETACAAFATLLARKPQLRDAVVELSGPLGSGKTTFARHLLRALGVSGPVKSPTYALIEPYAVAGCEVFHFDFYRLNDQAEWYDAGLRDLFAQPGLKLVEWPERGPAERPAADLRVHIAIENTNKRVITVQAQSACGLALLR